MKSPKLTKSQARIIPVEEYVVRDREGQLTKVKGKGSNSLTFKFSKNERAIVDGFVGALASIPEWRGITMELSVSKYIKGRSLAQNRLMWALLSILSMEVYESFGYEEILYEDCLDLYAPKVESKLTEKQHNVTSSKMNTMQMAALINGIMHELFAYGISITDPADIKHYWVEWQNWRFNQKIDPISELYQKEEDYRSNVNYCECCFTYLGREAEDYNGHLAHIVTKGSGGADGTWNRLHLCAKCHLFIQHQSGWEKLIEENPALENKINTARSKGGHLPLAIGEEQKRLQLTD